MSAPRWGFRGEVAVVTGATKGIGRGIAPGFAEATMHARPVECYTGWRTTD